jgi:serine protease Do
MIIQQLSFEIIDGMREIDSNAQIDMIQTMDQEEPMLAVTHIHQGTQADEMEWPPGELIIRANDRKVRTLAELKASSGKTRAAACSSSVVTAGSACSGSNAVTAADQG